MDYEQLKEHVLDYFGDTSRPASETKADLRALSEEIDMLIESMGDTSDEG